MELFFDGASKFNNSQVFSPSGAGAVLYIDSGKIHEFKKYLGHATNNQAEYHGLILGLEGILALDEICDTTLVVKGDSNLVIMQMSGLWKVKNVILKDLHLKANQLLNELKKRGITVSFQHIYREYNTVADKLSNLAIQSFQASDNELENSSSTF
jgi:ribonuclease HI